jgi:DNA-binding transcriptional regulator LsrR (DeoR family)
VQEEDTGVHMITLYTRVLLQLRDNPRISQETLARRLDVTMRTAQRHLTELEREGYIRVDRDKKPFEYAIDWSKKWRYVEGLRLIVFHPDVKEALRGLSDVAYRAYESALQNGQDPSEALRHVFSENMESVALP